MLCPAAPHLGAGAAWHSGQWQLLGPAPAAVAKVNNRYRYRITLTGQPGKEFRALLSYLLQAAHKDRENKGVSVYADVDPYNG